MPIDTLSKEYTMDYKLGDIVEAYGIRGKIVELSDLPERHLPIVVQFGDGFTKCFDRQGTRGGLGEEPILVFIKREKGL